MGSPLRLRQRPPGPLPRRRPPPSLRGRRQQPPPPSETAVSTAALDEARVRAFGERMVGVLNSAAIALMSSIGHQTGLFDTMAGLPPSSTGQIAEAAGLNERYVREW